MRRLLMDLLICPYDGDFPLRLYSFKEFEKENKMQDAPTCEVYCSVLNSIINKSNREEVLTNCRRCLQTRIVDGVILCSKCKRWYPIVDEIPSIMPDELREYDEISLLEKNRHLLSRTITEEGLPFNLKGGVAARKPENNIEETRDKKSEIVIRDQQATIYDSLFPEIDNIIETFSILKRLKPQMNNFILDVGAGTGRITAQYVKDCKGVVAVDFSRDSLLLLKERLMRMRRELPHILQCDATLLPFRDEVFDKVLSTQVIQHIPGELLRRRALYEIHRVLKNDGELVISVYNHNLDRLRAKIPKEGYHTYGKIYYHDFYRSEFVRLLSDHFIVRECTGIVNKIPKISKWLGYPKKLSMLIEKTFFSYIFGGYLLAKCDKR